MAKAAETEEVPRGNRTSSTWYDGFEKRAGLKKGAHKFQALPPCSVTHSPFMDMASVARLGRSFSDGALEARIAPFMKRQLSHSSCTRRHAFGKAQVQMARESQDAQGESDVEFYGAQGALGFRKYLVSKFGSILAGWRHMDPDKNGRLTFGEFTMQCRRMGYHGNLMQLWRELDQNLNGRVSIGEIDPEAGKYLGLFKLELLRKYGDMLSAWQQGLDTNDSGRIEEKEVKACLDELGLDLNCAKLFDFLRASPKGPGVTLADFDVDAHRRLITGDLKGLVSGKSNKEFVEDLPDLGIDVELPEGFNEKPTHGGALKFRQEQKDKEREAIKHQADKVKGFSLGLETADGFKAALIKRFGSLTGAWRYLDLDGNGRLTFGEFCLALQRNGLAGNLKKLWKELDAENRGYVTFGELDPEGDKAWNNLRSLIIEKHGSMLMGWCKEFDRRGVGNLSETDFVKACGRLGYEGNAKKLFRLRRPEKGRETISLHDFDVKAQLCLARGDFRMLTDPEVKKEDRKSLLDMTFEERKTGGFFHQIRRGWVASRSEEFKTSCREANFPDRLIDTPEEFEQQCIRTYGSMVSAWRMCLDLDANGRLTFEEFCVALRRIGYGGDLTKLWRHYDVNDDKHISLKELDPKGYKVVYSFLDKLGERYGHLDNAWKKGFGKDPHECIEIADLTQACEAIGYEYSAKQLFKALQPYPGRLGLTLWDVDPICTRKRQQARFAPLTSSPKLAHKHYVPSHGELNDGSAGRSAPSRPPKPNAKKQPKIPNEPLSPNANKWDTPDPEIVPGVSSVGTMADSMRLALRNTHGSTLAAWRKALDINMVGTVFYPMFTRTMQDCTFQSKLRELWHELKKHKDEDYAKQPHPSETVTFRDLDPKVQRLVDKAREKFVERHGSLNKAWEDLSTLPDPDPKMVGNDPTRPDQTGGKKARVDGVRFAQVCEQVDVPAGARLFRLLLPCKSRRSIAREDFEALLIGVPPEERHAVWAEGEERKKPSLLPKALQDDAPAKPPDRKFYEKASKDMRGANFLATTLEDFKKMLMPKYGSLFSAWQKAIDTDHSGTVVDFEFYAAVRALGVEACVPLWKELIAGKVNDLQATDGCRACEARGSICGACRATKVSSTQVLLKDFDPDTGEMFEELKEILQQAGGGEKGKGDRAREGWRKHFELARAHPVNVTNHGEEIGRNDRTDEAKFVKQCAEIGFSGDAAKLFKLLRPCAERSYLFGDDLFKWRDTGGQLGGHAKHVAKGTKRAGEDNRKARVKGTMSQAIGDSYNVRGLRRDVAYNANVIIKPRAQRPEKDQADPSQNNAMSKQVQFADAEEESPKTVNALAALAAGSVNGGLASTLSEQNSPQVQGNVLASLASASASGEVPQKISGLKQENATSNLATASASGCLATFLEATTPTGGASGSTALLPGTPDEQDDEPKESGSCADSLFSSQNPASPSGSLAATLQMDQESRLEEGDTYTAADFADATGELDDTHGDQFEGSSAEGEEQEARKQSKYSQFEDEEPHEPMRERQGSGDEFEDSLIDNKESEGDFEDSKEHEDKPAVEDVQQDEEYEDEFADEPAVEDTKKDDEYEDEFADEDEQAAQKDDEDDYADDDFEADGGSLNATGTLNGTGTLNATGE